MDELARILTLVKIYSAIRKCYATITELAFLGVEENVGFKNSANKAILNTHAIKRNTMTAKFSWEQTLQPAGEADLKDMLDILLQINKIQSNEDRLDIGNHATKALKLTPAGSCCLSDAEKRELAAQLRDARGPGNMELESCRLLMNTVGKTIASYSPGTNDPASLPSAAPLVVFIQRGREIDKNITNSQGAEYALYEIHHDENDNGRPLGADFLWPHGIKKRRNG